MMQLFSKKFYLTGVLITIMFSFIANGQNLVSNGGAEEGLKNWDPGQVEIIAKNSHSGKNCFKTKIPWIISTAVIPVDTAESYQYSGWFKSADDKTVRVFLALMPLDANSLPINSPEINPVAGTETELAEACKVEDVVIKIKDAGHWGFTKKTEVIAFNILDDYKDLPNRNISPIIVKAEKKNQIWEVTLDKPCGKAYPAGTKIRQHEHESTYMYLATENLHSKEWVELSGDIKGMSKFGAAEGQFWQGTKYVKAVVLALGEGSVYFDDIKFGKQDTKALIVPEVKQRQGALMDFDFSGIGGKKQITDRTGNFTMFSDCGAFVEEYNALRTSFGSRFRIPCNNDAFGEAFTINAWIIKSSYDFLYHTPILGRGYQEPGFFVSPHPGYFDFQFYVDIRLPGFYTRNGGLATTGYYYNMNIQYLEPQFSKIKTNMPLALNQWQYLVGVYDHGATRLYLNGELIAENPKTTTEPLLRSNCDLYLGAYRVKGESDNKVAAEMLIKSLRIDDRALTGSEIAAIYNQEKNGFPLNTKYPELAETRQYYPVDMLPLDPEMKNRLRQTAEYFKNLASMPVSDRKTITSKVETTPKSLNFFINGERTSPVSAHGYIYRNDTPHRLSEFVADFAAAGVNMNALSIPPTLWQGEGKYDWGELESYLELYIKTNPNSQIMLAIGTDAPKWFRDQYPEEHEEYYVDWQHPELGKKRWDGYGGFLGSDKYLKTACQMLHDVVSHIEKSKYAKYVYGYQFSGGDAGEWYWPGQFAGANTATGYSTPTRNAFRDYLRNVYQNDITKLREAWNNSAVTFETVELPSPQERFRGENFFFHDPAKSRNVQDCRHFMQYRNILNVTECGKAVREAADRNKIITTYYGYSMLYCGAPALAFSGLQTVSDILKSPYIDFIATPIDYGQRRGGEPGSTIAGFLGTAQLYGKGIWREEDLRTHLHTRLDNGRTASLRETNEVIRRAYGYTIADNYGMWYICQSGIHGYHQDGIMEDSAKMKKIADESVKIDRIDVAEVALIFDEKDSLNYLVPDPGYNQFVVGCIWETYMAAHQMGAPFKVHFVDDLANQQMPDYKLYIFLNQWSVSAEQMAMINAKVRKNNAVAVWVYASGYLDGKHFNPDNMEKLTGFKFKEFRELQIIGGGMNFTANQIIVKGLPPFEPKKVGPFFSILPDSSYKILAKWNNGEHNSIALKEMGNWRSIWTLFPPSAKMLTNLCEYAGVHLYSRGGETLIANDSYIMLVSPKAGDFTIELPQEENVIDCIENVSLGKTKSIKGHLVEPGTTKIFKIK